MTDRGDPPAAPAPAAPGRLPGDPDPLARMLRVDLAGEQGAVRIYEGQLAVLGHTRAGPVLRHMLAQERRHLAHFAALVPARGVRPTALAPFWHVAGFALGAATALLGEKAAMACTVAVEEVIDGHYGDQIDALGQTEPEVRARLAEFRAEEVEHRDTALSRDAVQAPAYSLLTGAIKAGSRLAIWLSSRV